MVSGPPPTTSLPILLVVTVCGVLVAGSLVTGRFVTRAGRDDLARTAIPWALAGPVLLGVVGVAVPIALVPRYWLSSLPGVALLVAVAANLVAFGISTRLSLTAATGLVVRGALALLVVATLTLLGIPGQQAIRRADGHGEDAHGATTAASMPALRGLPIVLATGGDALLIGELSPQLQRRVIGWRRSTAGRNVSEIAWSDDRLSTTLRSHGRAVLLLRDTAVLGHTRSLSFLRRTIAKKSQLRKYGVNPTNVQIVFQGGSWIVAECPLQLQRTSQNP